MKILNNNIKWIMLISGIATCSMIYAAISPQAALLTSFGDSLVSPLSDLIVRSWGFLVFLMGVMLIYGAYRPIHRPLILTVVGSSKLFFISLVILYGYSQPALPTVIFDSLMVLIYFSYIITNKANS